jgi:hypothetical protein
MNNKKYNYSMERVYDNLNMFNNAMNTLIKINYLRFVNDTNNDCSKVYVDSILNPTKELIVYPDSLKIIFNIEQL